MVNIRGDIESLIRASNKPLLFVDADEVLLQFVQHLEKYFLTVGYELALKSFQLLGNVIHTQSGNPATKEDMKRLIAGFFDACVDDIPAVDQAAEKLSQLSDPYQIYIVTNVPKHCANRRASSLEKHGMPYPVIANQGNKGRLIAALSTYSQQHAAFIDDLPHQHASVKKHAPQVHRIHYIADKRLQKLIPKAEAAHSRANSWDELTNSLMQLYEDHTHANQH